MADIVLVSERVRLAMVFHRIGLVPDPGRLVHAAARRRPAACEGADLLGARSGAAEALQMGLALEVLASDVLLPRALAIARSFCCASATAMSLSKRALQASLQSELGAMLDMEAAGQAIASGSDYAAESVRRFGAKEPAQFAWPLRTKD